MCYISEFFSILVKFYSISPVLLLQRIMNKRFVSSSIDHLFDNLETGKSLEFWIQKSVRTLSAICFMAPLK